MFRPLVKINLLFALISLAAACKSPTSSVPAIATVVPQPSQTQTVVLPTVTLSLPAPSLTLPPPTQMPTGTTASVKPLYEWINLGPDQGPVYDQSWSLDERLFAAADYDQIRVWEINADREAHVLKGHVDFVTGLAWSPNANVLASASQDGTVRLWDGTSFTQTAVLEIGQPLGCLTWSPNGEFLASIGYEYRHVRLWNPGTGLLYAEARHNSLPGWSISWSPDGNRVASGCGKWQQPHVGEIIVWTVS